VSDSEENRYLLAELETLRREISDMRAEQREIARAVTELAQTFRTLAVHLGIGAEPYRKSSVDPARDLPGFG
jgi:prefoldin subunit 5